MTGKDWLSERFEASRTHLRAVAYRMLGSAGEADDAVQECWLRVSRADTASVENPEGWLTTVLARICLNILRSRKRRREEALEEHADRPALADRAHGNPQDEALLAESVGLALLVVLERLTPAERVALVLHDVFGVSFEEIASIVERTPEAARQLASRARRRVRGGRAPDGASLSQQRLTVDAFLSALRAADLQGLLDVLDPNVVRRTDSVAMPPGTARQLRGAVAVAEEALTYRSAARTARPVVVDQSVGFVIAPRGRLRIAIRCRIRNGKIVLMDVIADPERLRRLKLAVPPN
jgi:RNA polymerase sigma factor (sigma-70 family)